QTVTYARFFRDELVVWESTHVEELRDLAERNWFTRDLRAVVPDALLDEAARAIHDLRRELMSAQRANREVDERVEQLTAAQVAAGEVRAIERSLDTLHPDEMDRRLALVRQLVARVAEHVVKGAPVVTRTIPRPEPARPPLQTHAITEYNVFAPPNTARR